MPWRSNIASHVIQRILRTLVPELWACHGVGQADIARHVIQCVSIPRFLSQMAFDDVVEK
jgi:hypothetical protein